ncbi:hypothetical protein KUTeg_000478 [Tegillarca granosa]|uniref:Glucose-methanol-choline oxidoreductase C-terminal domain-containing protein n=1 Tax=Tegillarca granosa TaxID=220873 RepID=A0ABQ9FYQ5_TEGGR|nr:hypothetical protein KUTeg_000478 [Tegillarca granosa]
MRKVGSRLITRPPVAFGQESVEQCYTSTKIDSDEFWKCVLRQQSAAGLHAVRSCPMGAPNDRWAVVDPKLRVYGIKGLRVVDASVMPEVSSGNPMGPAIMIGERAADFIKSENKLGNY